MKVTSVMSKHLVKLPASITTEDALERLEREAVHHALVTIGDDLVGVVCRCDLERVSAKTRVVACMKKDYVFVDESTTAKEAAEMMQRWGIGFLPVIGESGELGGVVTRRDLRRTGFLPNRRGVDRCASCGETHSLEPCTDDWVPIFCRKCSEPPTHPGGFYATLGGGD
ncbi:MAG TPA: CBS domain-containing protein [Polyangiaceae bacterium]